MTEKLALWISRVTKREVVLSRGDYVDLYFFLAWLPRTFWALLLALLFSLSCYTLYVHGQIEETALRQEALQLEDELRRLYSLAEQKVVVTPGVVPQKEELRQGLLLLGGDIVSWVEVEGASLFELRLPAVHLGDVTSLLAYFDVQQLSWRQHGEGNVILDARISWPKTSQRQEKLQGKTP